MHVVEEGNAGASRLGESLSEFLNDGGTLVSNIDQHPGAARDMDWLKSIHPATIVDHDVSAEAMKEILDAESPAYAS